MKHYEKESLLKNFLVFFSLLEILLVLLFFELYKSKQIEYKENLFKTMQLCNYTMDCTQFELDFVAKDKFKLNELAEEDGLTSYFSIPDSEKYSMKMTYLKENMVHDISVIRYDLWFYFIISTLILFGTAIFFTLYSLKPIRKALRLNEEFIKDILHDFNTPISSMVLNIEMLKEDKEDNVFLQRISSSIDNIGLLQNNLTSYLQHRSMKNEPVNIGDIARERVLFMQNIYPKIRMHYSEDMVLHKNTHKETLIRILDNLLTNAAKYNKPNGEINVSLKGNIIGIVDNGRGIKDVSKVFERYYKEHTRSLGLGLHIVKKLSIELDIEITIESELNIGTKVYLDLKHMSKE